MEIVERQVLAAPTAQLVWIEHRCDTPAKVRKDGRSILTRYLLPTLRVGGKALLRKPQTGAWICTAVVRQAHHEDLRVSRARQDCAFLPFPSCLGEDPEFTANQGVPPRHA